MLIAELSDDPDCEKETYKSQYMLIDFNGNVIHRFGNYEVSDLGEEVLLLKKAEPKETLYYHIHMGITPKHVKKKYWFVDLRNATFKPSSSFRSDRIFNFKDGFFGGRNRKGKLIISPQNERLEKYPELIRVVRNGKIKIINEDGKRIIAGRFDDIEELPNNLLVIEKNEKYGLYNTEGRQILPVKYNDIWYRYDLSMILLEKTNELEGLISTDGSQILPCIYDKIQLPGEQQFMLYKKNQWEKYDLQSRQSSPLPYTWIFHFNGGFACAELGGKFGVIDKDGNVVEEFIYSQQLENLGNGLFIFTAYPNRKSQMGVLNVVDKSTPVPPVYNSLKIYYPDYNSLLAIDANNEHSVIDLENNQLTSKYKNINDLLEALNK